MGLLSQLTLTEAEHSFQIPRVIDHGFIFGRPFTVEERLEGHAMSEALSQYSGPQRERLIEDYMETATKLGTLCKTKDNIFGEIAKSEGIRSEIFRSYLHDRALAALSKSGLQIQINELIEFFAEPEIPALVHVDYYPANVLCDGGKVTAVLDFGSTSFMGCGSFNPAIALAFLDPKITPTANDLDYNQAEGWLQQRSTRTHFIGVKRWLAVYWSICGFEDDPVLFHWCRDTLST